MVVRRRAARPTLRKYTVINGVASATVFQVHNNSLLNLRRGLVERVFFVEGEAGLEPPPRPREGIFPERLGGLAARLSAIVGLCRPVAPADFVESRRPSKRTVYRQALESLRFWPVAQRDSFCSTFVKCEKINTTKKPDPAPRVIQPRTPRYNIEVGVFLAHIEHAYYHGIDEMWNQVWGDGGRTVMKGLNVLECGENMAKVWGRYNQPVALGLDAKRFDQHVSYDALFFEHGIYLQAFAPRWHRRLARLLEWQRHNRGYARASDGMIKYQVRGGRMSGDMNTALGNIILMTLMVLDLNVSLNINASLINNGDDCVLIFERMHLERVQAAVSDFFLQYGFQIVVEPPVFELEGIEFCQMHPVWTPRGWVMVRNSATSMSKDAVLTRPMAPSGIEKWLWCVGKAGLALAAGIPVHQEYYKYFIRNGAPGGRRSEFEQNEGFFRLGVGLKAEEAEVHPRTRASFARAFGVEPDMQVALECKYAELELPRKLLPDGMRTFNIYEI